MNSCSSFFLSCQTHPDARTYRARVLQNYEQFRTIFGHFNEPFHRNDSEPCDEPLEFESVCPVNYDSNIKDIMKHMRWTSDMDSCLSEILVQQIKLGNRSRFDHKLKPAALEAAVLAINEKFKLYMLKDHIKNRLKTWKKQYDILKEVLRQSGFEWDESRKMVIADDSVWNEYIKVHILDLLLISILYYCSTTILLLSLYR
jgi:hypothetical protein